MKVLILYGKSCSGKDSVMKKLLVNDMFEKIVTTTTRPKREEEIDGWDYYFESRQTMSGLCCVKGYYIKENEIWSYGVDIDRIEETGKIKVIILTENQIEEFVNRMEEEFVDVEIITARIDASLADRIYRYTLRLKLGYHIQRDPEVIHNDALEMLRRIQSDENSNWKLKPYFKFYNNNDNLEDIVNLLTTYYKYKV